VIRLGRLQQLELKDGGATSNGGSAAIGRSIEAATFLGLLLMAFAVD